MASIPTTGLRCSSPRIDHIKFFNNQRGYVRHVVTPNRWQADFQVLEKVSVRDGHVSTRKSCVVEHGKSGLVNA